MADNDDRDDENTVPFPRIRAPLQQEDLAAADIKTGMSYFLEYYDHVAVVGYRKEDGGMDVVENVGDPAALYELLQQGAANVALEAIEMSQYGTKH